MSAAEQLVEKTRDLILDELKSSIPAALTVIRSDRNDPEVTTEPPQLNQYFIYEEAKTLQPPCVFVIVDSAEFPEESIGPNHINAVVRVNVNVVVEDREAQFLAIKSERYQAAIFRVLHRKLLQDTGKNIKIYTRVIRASFSPVYMREIPKGMGKFRKEVSCELEVKHWENPF